MIRIGVGRLLLILALGFGVIGGGCGLNGYSISLYAHVNTGDIELFSVHGDQLLWQIQIGLDCVWLYADPGQSIHLCR